MSENQLSGKAREALRHIRNSVMHTGKVLSVRDLMGLMEYKSPRSALLLMQELEQGGFLRKRLDGSYSMLKDIRNSEDSVQTINVPLVGTVTCGAPILAQENIEAMIPVSTALAKPGSKYFMLRAKGDSMNEAGINDRDLILVRQQNTAENGQTVVALIDDEATVKEFNRNGNFVTLTPRSSNKKHQPIIVTDELKVQGLVIATIPIPE
ncbi:transcriptional repressor LexA [Pseudochryseolinea flava]|uniref:Repressor LexA n=1 Tax=Pseudochryseolinea flava TaxID=2059302 RepID=A0A364Y758_9BACT|nr:transcriptional repressor LexA [Pseudochryseolinea flava]RAW01974.1 repressor LexA [Pseudochryseolinea flava]